MQPKNTIIHLVRHGEVENPQNIRYGRLPGYHLNEHGRKQVEQTCLFFLGRNIRHIYCSPLERTQQTATIIGMMFPYVSITLDSRILELKTSARFEGKSRDKGFYFPLHSSSDAETQEDVVRRLRHFVEEKIIAHAGEEIICITHADPIALYVTHQLYCTIDPHGGRYPGYASIYSMVFEGINLKSVWYREVTPRGSLRSGEKKHEELDGIY